MSAKNIRDAEILMDIGIDHKIALTLEWEEQKIIMAELGRLRAELDKAREDEKILRHLLWLRHGCDMLYGDDGERQCGHCRLDFNRDDPSIIMERWEQMGMEQMRRAALVPAASGEKPESNRCTAGLWPANDLRRAFVDGARWWEWRSTNGTMWQSDRNVAEEEAERKYPGGQPAPAVKEKQNGKANNQGINTRRAVC